MSLTPQATTFYHQVLPDATRRHKKKRTSANYGTPAIANPGYLQPFHHKTKQNTDFRLACLMGETKAYTYSATGPKRPDVVNQPHSHNFCNGYMHNADTLGRPCPVLTPYFRCKPAPKFLANPLAVPPMRVSSCSRRDIDRDRAM